jgi:hypothetical protein
LLISFTYSSISIKKKTVIAGLYNHSGNQSGGSADFQKKKHGGFLLPSFKHKKQQW